MNIPQYPISHIVPANCRVTTDQSYFQDKKGVGYDFIIVFGLKKPENIFEPQVQIGQFQSIPQRMDIIALKKEEDDLNIVSASSLTYLRLDEFLKVRRCINTHCYHALQMDTIVDPVSASVYTWMKKAQYELRMFGEDFFDKLRQTITHANLDILRGKPWIK